MGRPPFSPDDAQADTLDAMDIAALRIEQLARDVLRLARDAKRQGIPIEVIARTARLSKKTVYRRLAGEG